MEATDMNNKHLYENLGSRIRAFRKSRNMSLAELAGRLGKSIATISKYESGDVAISVDVLLDICSCFDIDPGTLLPQISSHPENVDTLRYHNYYEELLYLYWYNGEQKRVRKALIDNRNSSRTHSILYFDIDSPNDLESATFIYLGEMNYSDTGTVFLYTNSIPPFDKITVRIPSFTRGASHRVGLMSSVSVYYQNVASKVIATASPVKDPSSLLTELKLNTEDIRTLRRTNFLII